MRFTVRKIYIKDNINKLCYNIYYTYGKDTQIVYYNIIGITIKLSDKSKKIEIECLKYVTDAVMHFNEGVLVFNNTSSNILFDKLKVVIHNPKLTKFPDFLSREVIIEHFSVTSSKENRKGSSFKVEQNINNKETQKHIEEWKKSCINKPFESNTINSEVIENTYDDLSYKNFIASLTKNLEHHIDSLKQFTLNNRKVVFLIELQDALMGVYRQGLFYRFYELNKDKDALGILKTYADLLDIIIFRANDRIEIIDMKKFDKLYKNSYCETDIRGGRLREFNLLSNIDIFKQYKYEANN